MSTSTPTSPYRPPWESPGDRAGTRTAGIPEPAGPRPERSVVVGVDGGECALAAVRWAAEEATRRDAALRIVHAAPYLGRRFTAGSTPPELPRARRITGQAYTLARHTGPGLQAETEVVPGEPSAVLLQAAASAQLLVLGISTTGAADELVLAPVAQRVVARSNTPVVIVPRRRPTEQLERPVVAVLGLGDPEDDDPVVEFAADTARRSGLPLTVLRVRDSRPSGAAARHEDLDVTEQVLPAASPTELLHAVGTPPLLVLTSGHGSFLHRLLDGPHRWLLRHCTSPMAMVPPVHRPETDPHEEIIAVG